MRPEQETASAPTWELAFEAARTFLQEFLDSIRAAQPQGTYYIAPQGDDANAGTSAGTPWRTFAHAWDILQPGDTLVLLDGTYTAAINGLVQPNIRNGEPGKPITIRALNDGKAVVDGEGQDIPVRLGENWGPDGPIGDWFVVEGIVARNGTLSSIRLEHANHNVLRRVSAYDADPDDNSLAIGIAWSDHNLVEDCVAAGTGRYMINVFTSSDNTIRRCFTMWQQWDGRHFCGVSWPNGNNVGVYNSSNTTVENVIAYGRALTGIFIQANDDSAVADNNQVLGSMALLQGADYDGSPWTYGTGERQPTARPGPITNPYGEPCPDNITQWEWGGHRQGFNLYGQGELHDNVFRDILATGNVGVGWGSQHPGGPGPVGAVIDHATIYGNGSDITGWESVQGGDIYIDRRDELLGNGGLTVTNSRIANSGWANQGEGARFQYRYVERQLTDQPLLPWPMESRIKSELGLSVGKLIDQYRR
ncbi:MAG: right-handed parallel beta-helix repeat-containing protein [Caldilineaceae bacterium]